MRSVAQRYLAEEVTPRGLVATEIAAGEGGWSVEVEQANTNLSDVRTRVGNLVVSYDLKVTNTDLHVATL